jgi:hypothetical protein
MDKLTKFISWADFKNKNSNINNVTFYVYKTKKHKYVKTSITNLPIDSPRVKCFLAHNGNNHRVAGYTLKDKTTVDLYLFYSRESII